MRQSFDSHLRAQLQSETLTHGNKWLHCGYMKLYKNYSTHLQGDLHLHESSATTCFQCLVLDFLSLSLAPRPVQAQRKITTKMLNPLLILSRVLVHGCQCHSPQCFPICLKRFSGKRINPPKLSTGDPNSSAETTQFEVAQEDRTLFVSSSLPGIYVDNTKLQSVGDPSTSSQHLPNIFPCKHKPAAYKENVAIQRLHHLPASWKWQPAASKRKANKSLVSSRDFQPSKIRAPYNSKGPSNVWGIRGHDLSKL